MPKSKGGGANTNPGGQPHINGRKSQFQGGGGGKSIPGGESPPPNYTVVIHFYQYLWPQDGNKRCTMKKDVCVVDEPLTTVPPTGIADTDAPSFTGMCCTLIYIYT